MASASLLLIALIIGAILYRHFIHPLFISPLKRIPSPSLIASCTNIWTRINTLKCLHNARLVESHERLGPVVRVGKNEVSVTSVQGLKEIYLGNMDKTDYYELFWYFDRPNLFSTPTHSPHARRRRLLQPAYSRSALSSDVTTKLVMNVLNHFLTLIEKSFEITEKKKLEDEKPMDLYILFYCLTMDVITAFTFSPSLGTNLLLNEKERTLLEIFHRRRPWSTWKTELPGWVCKLCLPEFLSDDNDDLEEWGMETALTAEKLRQSRELIKLQDHDESEWPGVFRQMLDENKGEEIDLRSVASEMLDHIDAGHDTTAVTLTFLTHHLLQNPKLQLELHQQMVTLAEVDERMNPSWKDIDSFPFLEAFVLETLRVFPAIPGPEPRLVSKKDGVVIEDYYIPEGTIISSAPCAVNLNPTLFVNPEEFDPKRWMHPSNSNSKGDGLDALGLTAMKNGMFTFGQGPRVCIGKELAVKEMKLFLFHVFRKWKAVWPHDSDPIAIKESMKPMDSRTTWPVGEKLEVCWEKW